MSYDYINGTDSEDDNRIQPGGVPIAVILFVGMIILFVTAAISFGGPKERVAIAEAAVWVAQNQFPAGENDYDGSKAVNDPKFPDSSAPRIEFPSDIKSVSATAETIPAQVIFESLPGCVPCKKWENDAQRLLPQHGWTIGNAGDEHFMISGVGDVKANTTYPRFRFQQNGADVEEWNGYRHPYDVANRLRDYWDKSPKLPQSSQTVASSGAAGTIHAKSQIQSVFAWWRANIGDGVKAEMRWDRSGAQSFPLLAKGDWSALAVFGKFGHMNLSAKGAVNLPVDAIGFGYEVDGDDITIDADPVTLKGLGSTLNPMSQQSSQVGPSGIGPGTVLTILSVIRGVWAILHPSADLQLGGNVSATAVLTGDTLAIDFQQCPSVKLVAIFTFQLRVDRVEISENSVRAVFGGSRLVRERTFVVQ